MDILEEKNSPYILHFLQALIAYAPKTVKTYCFANIYQTQIEKHRFSKIEAPVVSFQRNGLTRRIEILLTCIVRSKPK